MSVNNKPMRNFKTSLATDVSMGASSNSSSQILDDITGFSMHFIWSAGSSPVGTFTVEASNDDTNWTTISGTSFAVSGNSGNYLVNVEFPNYSYVRGVYTRTSGSATLNINIVGKIH